MCMPPGLDLGQAARVKANYLLDCGKVVVDDDDPVVINSEDAEDPEYLPKEPRRKKITFPNRAKKRPEPPARTPGSIFSPPKKKREDMNREGDETIGTILGRIGGWLTPQRPGRLPQPTSPLEPINLNPVTPDPNPNPQPIRNPSPDPPSPDPSDVTMDPVTGAEDPMPGMPLPGGGGGKPGCNCEEKEKDPWKRSAKGVCRAWTPEEKQQYYAGLCAERYEKCIKRAADGKSYSWAKRRRTAWKKKALACYRSKRSSYSYRRPYYRRRSTYRRRY